MSTQNNLARRPPMGWNSWLSFGSSVREDEVKAQADYMAEHLHQHGWEYVVVDAEWFLEDDTFTITDNTVNEDESKAAVAENVVMDDFGRLQPALSRFPSAAGGVGFKPLADYVHSKGLKFGIHILRGIARAAVHQNLPLPTSSGTAQDIADTDNICLWCPDMYGVNMDAADAQAWYDALFAQYAEWGLDFIKIDDFGSPYQPREVEAVARAIRNSGRDIVLSLSPGQGHDTSFPEHRKQWCEMWRTGEDFWDKWEMLKNQFDFSRAWQTHSGPGHWPDADMLALGRIAVRQADVNGPERQTRFSQDEQILLLTLWCMQQSPLMFGGDLRAMDDWTFQLLTNDEILAVDQTGINGRELWRESNRIIWGADAPNGDRYVAVFNLGEEATEMTTSLSELGFTSPCAVRDLWTRTDLGTVDSTITTAVPAHGARLFSLRAIRTEQPQ